MSAAIVMAEGLSAGYGRNTVLTDVTLNVEAGSLTGLCGPNGAGKSTFIKACLGMIASRSGDLRVLGGVPRGPGGRRLRLRMGYVPQNVSGGNLPVSVRDSVGMGFYGRLGFFRGLSRKDRLAVEQAMEACGILPLAEKLVRELSGGQAQRTAIARALAPDAELLLLDEPASSLDAEGRVELLRILKERREYRHITALLVSHDKATLGECGAIYRFNAGRVSKIDA